MPRTASSLVLTDHNEIREWAKSRKARPACVRGTGEGEDIGMLRLDFPGDGGEGRLEEISWDDWFQKFDESNLALLVQDKTAGGQESNFNKLVKRETVEQREDVEEREEEGGRGSAGNGRGRTVGSQGRGGKAESRTAARAEAGRKSSSRSSSGKPQSGASGRNSRTSSSSKGSRSSRKSSSRSAQGRKSSTREITMRGKKASRSTRSSRRKAA